MTSNSKVKENNKTFLAQEALKYVTFMRDVKEIGRWVDENEKYCAATELGDDLEQNEALSEEFQKFMVSFEDTGICEYHISCSYLYFKIVKTRL